jgi:hypothetical protein
VKTYLRVWHYKNTGEREFYPVRNIEKAIKKIKQLGQRNIAVAGLETNVHFPFHWQEWSDTNGLNIFQVMEKQAGRERRR